jgi:hypothetical protein
MGNVLERLASVMMDIEIEVSDSPVINFEWPSGSGGIFMMAPFHPLFYDFLNGVNRVANYINNLGGGIAIISQSTYHTVKLRTSLSPATYFGHVYCPV